MTFHPRRTAAALAVAGLAAATLAASIAPAAADHPAAESPGAAGRGQLVLAHPLRSLPTAGDVAAELTRDQFGTGGVRHGVDSYQLVYRTIDPRGRSTLASGLLAVPRNASRELRAVSYTHGTEISRTDAPSFWKETWAVGPALTYASAGFAAVAPDYLGLGVGPGPHPFLDIPSETTAAVDMLRAAREFLPRTGRALQRQVLVTGFSQGASAAVGLARALQGGADRWFRLGALAPVAGAYDWRGVELPALLDGTVEPPWNVGYLAYFLVSWNRLHHFYHDPAQVFEKQYAGTVEAIFDGLHSGQEMVGGLPGDLDGLLTEDGLALLTNPTGRLAAAIAAHDRACMDWTPRVPVRLYVSAGDEQVPAANSEHCLAGLRSRGTGDATIVTLPTFTGYGDSAHLGANLKAAAEIAAWFRALP
ncbi:MAG TPA: lipase [Pilimelia sp.]|nr:lipase [Pilimelia sp.]